MIRPPRAPRPAPASRWSPPRARSRAEAVDRAWSGCAPGGGSRSSARTRAGRRGYLSGTDDGARGGPGRGAARSRDNDAVWCLRGGYGTMRILERLDWGALAERPAAGDRLQRQHRAPPGRPAAGIVSFHGPHPAVEELPPFSADCPPPRCSRARSRAGVLPFPAGGPDRARTLRGRGRRRARWWAATSRSSPPPSGTPFAAARRGRHPLPGGGRRAGLPGGPAALAAPPRRRAARRGRRGAGRLQRVPDEGAEGSRPPRRCCSTACGDLGVPVARRLPLRPRPRQLDAPARRARPARRRRGHARAPRARRGGRREPQRPRPTALLQAAHAVFPVGLEAGPGRRRRSSTRSAVPGCVARRRRRATRRSTPSPATLGEWLDFLAALGEPLPPPAASWRSPSTSG